jgi:hypothetical protein
MVQMIRNELLGADSVAVNASDPSQVTIERSGATKTITIADDRVMLDDTVITREGIIVTHFFFTEVGNSLRLEFTLDSGPRTNKTFTGQTTLAYRN